MMNYLYYVVLLINREGHEFAVEVDDTYHKHVQPFKKLQLSDENLEVNEYLKYKGTDNVTGYEIASFLGAEGNIVFFHTDVSNWKSQKKAASIVMPVEMNKIQKDKLFKLIETLDDEDFCYYLNTVKFKNKTSYKLVHNHINLALLKKQVYNIDEVRESEDIKCKKMNLD
ncbi:MAG: hypothetical protein IKJ43_02395 [Bacilli bacterium]|nr:hypothetical protein [Bacilli bacterium]